MGQQPAFSAQSAGISGKLSAGAHYAVARYQYADGVAPYGMAYGPGCRLAAVAQLAQPYGQLAVCYRCAPADFSQHVPYGLLKGRAGG